MPEVAFLFSAVCVRLQFLRRLFLQLKRASMTTPGTVQWGIEESKVTCRMSEQQQDGAVSDD